MGLNVELLQLTHAVAQFVGLPSVLRRQGRFAHHPIAIPEPGIGHREIRIEAYGSLVERDGSSPFASSRFLPSQAVSLKGLKRRRRRLFERSIKLLHSTQATRPVCFASNSAVVLDGSIAQIGTRYLLTLKAVNCSNGDWLASTEAQASGNDILEALGKTAPET